MKIGLLLVVGFLIMACSSGFKSSSDSVFLVDLRSQAIFEGDFIGWRIQVSKSLSQCDSVFLSLNSDTHIFRSAGEDRQYSTYDSLSELLQQFNLPDSLVCKSPEMLTYIIREAKAPDSFLLKFSSSANCEGIRKSGFEPELEKIIKLTNDIMLRVCIQE